jgi:hypothetical protein
MPGASASRFGDCLNVGTVRELIPISHDMFLLALYKNIAYNGGAIEWQTIHL